MILHLNHRQRLSWSNYATFCHVLLNNRFWDFNFYVYGRTRTSENKKRPNIFCEIYTNLPFLANSLRIANLKIFLQ
jgi:hypothetical protein